MLYRPFGATGKQVSAVSFGGMRFSEPENLAKNVELLCHARSAGINYFDTAPAYCADRSEAIFGAAFRHWERETFYVSTKCGRHSGSELRESLERSLQRLNLERIDFFYIWHLMNEEDWEKRKRHGAVAAALQAREEGLIGHLFCSSHMQGNGLVKILAEGVFEGVLLGYNALNFPYREDAVAEAGQRNIAVVTMNPLAGGLIPRNPERFAFLKRTPEESVVAAALRFNLSHPAINSALVGFAEPAEIDQAVAAVENFTPDSAIRQQALRAHVDQAFDGLCTGCGYCLPCPAGIPIPQFLDTYNQLILTDGDKQAVTTRFRMHWGISPEQAADCTRCALCEERCTQHLPIMNRLKELQA